MDHPPQNALLRRITLRQLQIFEAIARRGSFTRAAEELFLTQPTVSMQIKKLEDSLGLPLFEQIGKQVYLTSAGKLIFDNTRQMMEILTNLEMAIADMKGLKTGIVRLAVVTTAKYFAPRALGRFCTLYPGIDVSLKVTNRERLLERLAENLDDLYIISRPPESEHVCFEPYIPNPLVVLVRRDHPLVGKRRIDPRELAEYPFIIREVGSGTRKATEDFFRERGIRLNIRMELGSNEAIKHAIDAGLGISILSWHTVAFEQDRGPLTMLDVEGFPIPWQWYVGHSRDKRLSLAAKAFLDFLRREGANIIP